MSTGVTHALVVAIDTYNQPKNFKNIKYAIRDAEELKKALITGGIDEENIMLLLNGNATQTAIKEHLKSLCVKEVYYSLIAATVVLNLVTILNPWTNLSWLMN